MKVKRIFGGKTANKGSFLKSVPERNSEVVWRSIKDGSAVLILNMKSGNIYLYDGKEAQIWALCDGKRTCHQIISMVKEAFPETREKNLMAFIDKLVEDRIIHIVK